MADEKRLIDANAFWNRLNNTVYDLFDPESDFGYSPGIIKAVLDQTKTVDAVGVVHGEWVVCGDGEYVPFMCSACGKTTSWYHAQTANYCPNCGAKMDGDGNA